MGLSIDEVLSTAFDGQEVAVNVVSNEEAGIASYAVGRAVFHGPAPIKPDNEPGRNRVRGSLTTSSALDCYFSDRTLQGVGMVQPFAGDATEGLRLSIPEMAGDPDVQVDLTLFGETFTLWMTRQDKLLVGAGPSLGQSEAGVWLLAFPSLLDPIG